eukprot:3800556-Pleurochrysis_carterae.AAC.1
MEKEPLLVVPRKSVDSSSTASPKNTLRISSWQSGTVDLSRLSAQRHSNSQTTLNSSQSAWLTT